LTFECQKIAKKLTFFSKKIAKIVIFAKNWQWRFFEDNDNFWQFLTFKW